MGYRFRRGDTTIDVELHCRRIAGVRVAIIDTLMLSSVWGDRAVSDKMLADLRTRFLRQPLDKFLQFVDPGIPFPDPDPESAHTAVPDAVSATCVWDKAS